jgi:amino acid transporter
MMDNAWVVPIFALIVVYALIGGVLWLFWAMTRYVFRLARKYWQLPPKAWNLLAAGFIMQAICVLILIGALYVSFLPPQPFQSLYDALLALGVVGVVLSSLTLLLWLALVIRAQRHISPLEVFFGQDRTKMKWVIVSLSAFPFLVVINIGGLYRSWLLGIFVAMPTTLYMLCVAGLIVHSSKDQPVA